jgi:hypothetical protein
MFNLDSKSIFVHGNENGIDMDTFPTVVNGRTYIPIRYLCKTFNIEIKYSEIYGFKKIEIGEGGY